MSGRKTKKHGIFQLCVKHVFNVVFSTAVSKNPTLLLSMMTITDYHYGSALTEETRTFTCFVWGSTNRKDSLIFKTESWCQASVFILNKHVYSHNSLISTLYQALVSL